MGGRGHNELGVLLGAQVQGRGGEAAGQAVGKVIVPLDVSIAQCQAKLAGRGPSWHGWGSPPAGMCEQAEKGRGQRGSRPRQVALGRPSCGRSVTHPQ